MNRDRSGWITLAVALMIAIHVLPKPPLARADDEADFAERVRIAIVALGAPTLAERERGRQALLDLGPRGLPLLPPPERLPNAAVREAVGEIRGQLEKSAACESVRASRWKLPGSMTHVAALEEIRKTTGNDIRADDLPAAWGTRRLAMPITDVDFWTGLDAFCHQADVRFEPQSGQRALRLRPLPSDPSAKAIPTSTSGPFLATISDVARKPLADSDRQLIRLTVQYLAEPRLRPLFLVAEAKDSSVRVPDSPPLAPFSPEAKLELPFVSVGKPLAVRYEFDAPRGLEATELDVTLRGTVTTAARTETIRFSKLLETPIPRGIGIARRRGGVTVSLERVAQSLRDGVPVTAIRLAVTYDRGGPAFESHQSWLLHNEIALEGADQTRYLPNGGFETLRELDGGLVIEYRFLRVPLGARSLSLDYGIPTLIIDAPLECTFRRVPLPAAVIE